MAGARREADSLNTLGVSLMAEGRFEEARAAFERAAEIFRRIGDSPDEAAALSNAGMALFDMAAFEESIEFHCRARALIFRVWDLSGQAKIRFRLGLALEKAGRLTGALTEYDAAAVASHKAAETDGEALALAKKGEVLVAIAPLPRSDPGLRGFPPAS